MLAKVREIGDRAEGGRACASSVDDRTDTPFGRRAVDWELKGVPVRVEIGPRDLENGTAMLARRIPGGKEPVPHRRAGRAAAHGPGGGPGAAAARSPASAASPVPSDVTTIEEAAEAAAAGGWARIPWADLGQEGEAKLAEQAVSVRCLVAEDGSVPDADDAPGNVAVVARAY